MLCAQDLLTVLTMAAEVTKCGHVREAGLCWQVAEKQVCGLLIGQLQWSLSADRFGVLPGFGRGLS